MFKVTRQFTAVPDTAKFLPKHSNINRGDDLNSVKERHALYCIIDLEFNLQR